MPPPNQGPPREGRARERPQMAMRDINGEGLLGEVGGGSAFGLLGFRGVKGSKDFGVVQVSVSGRQWAESRRSKFSLALVSLP